MTKLALLNDKNWFDKNCTNSFMITITGKPGKIVYEIGHYHGQEDEDDIWLQHITKSEDDKGFIAIDDWGGETQSLTYKNIIKFIGDQFSEIYEVKVIDQKKKRQKKQDQKNEIETMAMNLLLDLLNNKITLEEKIDTCEYCSQFIVKGNQFCNKLCQKGYKKQSKKK